jgi:hypothetical protein
MIVSSALLESHEGRDIESQIENRREIAQMQRKQEME